MKISATHVMMTSVWCELAAFVVVSDHAGFVELGMTFGNSSRKYVTTANAIVSVVPTNALPSAPLVLKKIAASSASLETGVGLLAAYTLGLAVPFLLAALLWNRLNLRRLNRYAGVFEKVGGAVLVAVIPRALAG